MRYRRSDISVSTPLLYDIRVAGALDSDFSDYVRGMTITTDTAAGEGPVSTVRGICPDHSALIGVLNALGNLGLVLISVRCLGAPGSDADDDLGNVAAAATTEVVTASIAGAATVSLGGKRLGFLRKGRLGRIGAGTGLIVGGLLTAGGPPCILVGAVSGAIIGGVAATVLGTTTRVEE